MVFRRVIGVSAVLVAAGLALAGCAPVKMGAAATLGNQRVTIATLDTESGHLTAAGKNYPGVFTLNQQQITQETLSWLIRFQINDQLAKQSGITVSTGQGQQALASILAGAQQSAAQSGLSNLTLTEILAANGLAPNLANQVGRFQAIENQYLTDANGGTMPTSSSSNLSTLESEFSHAQCLAAKSLNIKVNPQFGRLDYTKYAVTSGIDTVSRPAGPAAAPALTGLAPSC